MATKQESDIKLGVCVLTILFGRGAWLATNAVMVELPVFVQHLPEGWDLPSYMTVVIQLANIGPIILTSCGKIWRRYLSETFLIAVMLTVGSAAALCIALFWTKTSNIAGSEHSTALLVLMFFAALVDCSSAVTFLPFMNNLKSRYITLFYIGSGLSGFVPSAMTLLQGVGKVDCITYNTTNVTTSTRLSVETLHRSPQFAIKTFFLIIFGLMVISLIAFLMLNYLPYCKTELVKTNMANVKNSENNQENTLMDETAQNTTNDIQRSRIPVPYYLFLIGILSALTNGALPAVKSYAYLPYGPGSYLLSVALSKIANPLACLLVFWLPPVTSTALIGVVTLIGSLGSVYMLVLAGLSPNPPLTETPLGAILAVSVSVVVFFLLIFAKVVIASLFRQEGRSALVRYGAVTQLGSASGAAAMFVAINVFTVFTQKQPCT